jgi:hypothetical protein
MRDSDTEYIKRMGNRIAELEAELADQRSKAEASLEAELADQRSKAEASWDRYELRFREQASEIIHLRDCLKRIQKSMFAIDMIEIAKEGLADKLEGK